MIQELLKQQIKKHAFLMLLPLFSVFYSNAQNFEEDMKKVAERYNKGNYSIEVDYVFYGGHDGSIPLDQQTTSIRKKADHYHTNQFGTEMITNSKYLLVIDNQNKVIAIDKKRKEKKASSEEQEKVEALYLELYKALGIDPNQAKVSEADRKVSYLGISRGKKGYRISYSYGEYEHFELYFNTKNNQIEEVWMYFRKPMEIEAGIYKKPKVKLVYEKQKIDPIFNKNEFDISQYIRITANKEVVITNEKYKNFELINHLKN